MDMAHMQHYFSQMQLDLAPKVAEVYVQDVELQLKKPQRRKLTWMEETKDMPSPSDSLLTTAAAPSLVTEPVTAAAMAATKTKLAGGAVVVQARSLPLPSLHPPPTHVSTHATPSSPHSCKWSSRRVRPS